MRNVFSLNWTRFWLLLALLSIASVVSASWSRLAVEEYRIYAHLALTAPLFHHWPREYPPVSLLVFLLPLIFPLPYMAAFIVCLVFVVFLLLESRPDCPDGVRIWQMRVIVSLGLGTVGVLLGRYDLVVAWIGFLAVVHAGQHRYRAAWALSIVGVWLKLYPLVYWPIFLIMEWRDTGRWRIDRLVFGAILAVFPNLLVSLISPHQADSAIRYMVHRPLEIESLAAGIAALVTHHPRIIFEYGSVDVLSPFSGVIGNSLLLIGLLFGVWLLYHTARGRFQLMEAALIATMLMLLTAKVFSEQYLIWVIPLWALWKLDWRWIAALVLSTAGYPFGFMDHAFLVRYVVWIFLARNILLIWATVRFARGAALNRKIEGRTS